MGTLAKRLGQVVARSLESDSAQILKVSSANKVEGSLGKLFDTTLKESHDMRIFGMGTLCAMASLPRYTRFTSNMHGIYSTMEDELDLCDTDSPSSVFWERHQQILRRTPALIEDLKDVGVAADEKLPAYSMAADGYIQAIRQAGQSGRDTGGARLLGHAYCRYLADLMGGQVLGAPTRMALALNRSPLHYQFHWEHNDCVTRKEYVETIYKDLNVAGDRLSEKQKKESLAEAKLAFLENIHVYSEEPLWIDSMKGAANVAFGYIQRR